MVARPVQIANSDPRPLRAAMLKAVANRATDDGFDPHAHLPDILAPEGGRHPAGTAARVGTHPLSGIRALGMGHVIAGTVTGMVAAEGITGGTPTSANLDHQRLSRRLARRDRRDGRTGPPGRRRRQLPRARVPHARRHVGRSGCPAPPGSTCRHWRTCVHEYQVDGWPNPLTTVGVSMSPGSG